MHTGCCEAPYGSDRPGKAGLQREAEQGERRNYVAYGKMAKCIKPAGLVYESCEVSWVTRREAVAHGTAYSGVEAAGTPQRLSADLTVACPRRYLDRLPDKTCQSPCIEVFLHPDQTNPAAPASGLQGSVYIAHGFTAVSIHAAPQRSTVRPGQKVTVSWLRRHGLADSSFGQRSS